MGVHTCLFRAGVCVLWQRNNVVIVWRCFICEIALDGSVLRIRLAVHTSELVFKTDAAGVR